MGVGEGGRHGRMRVECGSIAPYFIFSIVGALSSSVTSSGRGSGIPPPAGCSITLMAQHNKAVAHRPPFPHPQSGHFCACVVGLSIRAAAPAPPCSLICPLLRLPLHQSRAPPPLHTRPLLLTHPPAPVSAAPSTASPAPRSAAAPASRPRHPPRPACRPHPQPWRHSPPP